MSTGWVPRRLGTRAPVRVAGVCAAAFIVVALAGCSSQPEVADETSVPLPGDSATVKAFVRTGQELVIHRNDVEVNIKADGGDVDITGDHLKLTITGNVDDLILDGASNTLTSADVTWLEVDGNRNVVKSGTVSETVLVEGLRNDVTFGGYPSVRVRGTLNTLNGKAQ